MPISRIIALIIIQEIQIQVMAIIAVLIQLFHLVAFLSSDQAARIKNQLYNMYIKAMNANIPSVRLIMIFISDIVYHNFVEYSSGCGTCSIHLLFSHITVVPSHIGLSDIGELSNFQSDGLSSFWLQLLLLCSLVANHRVYWKLNHKNTIIHNISNQNFLIFSIFCFLYIKCIHQLYSELQ